MIARWGIKNKEQMKEEMRSVEFCGEARSKNAIRGFGGDGLKNYVLWVVMLFVGVVWFKRCRETRLLYGGIGRKREKEARWRGEMQFLSLLGGYDADEAIKDRRVL